MREKEYQIQFIDLFKIIPSGVVVYRQLVSEKESPGFNRYVFSKESEADRTYKGEITIHSRRRLSRVLQLLLEITEPKWIINPVTKKRFKFRLAFQTLTLSAPQEFLSDSNIKKMLLEPYLRVMRKKGMRNYVWKAERQQNGNIHFHIITDTFVSHTVIRNEWNNIQGRRGFIEKFKAKWGHDNPNSTDVKSVSSERETLAYLLKYMMKNDKEAKQLTLTPVELKKRAGKVWDCSKNLKIKNETANFLDEQFYAHLERLFDYGDVRKLEEDFYKLYFFDAANRNKLIPEKYRQSYQNYLNLVKSSA